MPFRFSPGCCCGCSRDIIVSTSNCLLGSASNTQHLLIVGSPTGGTFLLAYGTSSTAPLPYNATAAQVQAALQAIPVIGPSGVTCSGGPLPGSEILITFDISSQPLALTAAGVALTGGTNVAVLIQTEPGNIPPNATATLTSDETQTITISGKPTGGTIVFGWGGNTVGVPWNGSAQSLAQALETLPGIGTGNLSLSGGPLSTAAVTITFIGSLAGAAQPLFTVDVSQLTGGMNVTATVTEMTKGGQVLGPQAIDPNTGTAIFTGVTTGQWEVLVQSPLYQHGTTTVGVTCAPNSPPISVSVPVTVSQGLILMPGVNNTPFAPPETLTVTDPLGSTMLSLLGTAGSDSAYPLGTAFYSGSNSFGSANWTCTWANLCDPPVSPKTVTGPLHVITYFLAVGCQTTLTAQWGWAVNGEYPVLSPECNQGGCPEPMVPPNPGLPTVPPAGVPCPCTGFTLPVFPLPFYVYNNIAYGASSIQGGPIDIDFGTEWLPNSDCVGLAGTFYTLYGYSPIVYPLPCYNAQVTEG